MQTAINAEILGADGTIPEWVMVARTGVWLGHPIGPEIITPERLQSALGYFAANYAANGADLVVDYHHASLAVPEQADRAPASGWIKQMELRNDGAELWGRVMWTTEAANAISRREYRYLSPVLMFNWPDRVTGQTVPMSIGSVALTNTPFMTELESLNEAAAQRGGASAPSAEGSRPMSLREMLAKALGLKPEEVSSRLGLASAEEDVQVANALVATAARVKELEAEATKPRPVVPAAVANALGIAEGSEEAAVRGVILRLQAGADLASVRTALGVKADADTATVVTAINALQASHRKSEAEALVDGAVTAGKVPPAQKAWWLQAAEKDIEGARQAINALSPLIDKPGFAGKLVGAGQSNVTDGQAAVCKKLGISADVFRLGAAPSPVEEA